MYRFSFLGVLSLLSVFYISPKFVFAHTLDVAYLDIGITTSSQLTLTVALHPYQAFELVRGGDVTRFNLKRLQERGDLIAAYTGEHVHVTRDGQECSWDAQDAHTPSTELEAVADGVTIVGALDCSGQDMELAITSTLFLEGFPSQTTIIRLEQPESFADRATLDRAHLTATVDISPLFLSHQFALRRTSPQVTYALPVVSACVIIGLGAYLLFRSLAV